MVQFSINENMINENACEVFKNDVMEEFFCKNMKLTLVFKQKKIQIPKNEDNEKKHKKIACSKNDLEITW